MNAVEIKKVIQDISDFRATCKNSLVDFSGSKEKVLYRIAIKSIGAKGYTPFIEELGMVLLDDSISFTKGKIQPRKIDTIDSIKVVFFNEGEKKVLKEIIYNSKGNDKKINEQLNIEKSPIKKALNNRKLEENNVRAKAIVYDEKSKWIKTFESIIENIKDNFLVAKLYFRNDEYCYLNLYNVIDFNDDYSIKKVNKTTIIYKNDYIIIGNIYDEILQQTNKDLVNKKIYIMQNEVTRIEGEVAHTSECCNSKKMCSEFCYNLIMQEEMNKTM